MLGIHYNTALFDARQLNQFYLTREFLSITMYSISLLIKKFFSMNIIQLKLNHNNFIRTKSLKCCKIYSVNQTSNDIKVKSENRKMFFITNYDFLIVN